MACFIITRKAYNSVMLTNSAKTCFVSSGAFVKGWVLWVFIKGWTWWVWSLSSVEYRYARIFLPWIHHKIVALLSCDTVTVQVYDQVLPINFLTWENAVNFIFMNSAAVEEPHSSTNAWCMHDKNGECMSCKWLLWIFKILIAAFMLLKAIFYQYQRYAAPKTLNPLSKIRKNWGLRKK